MLDESTQLLIASSADKENGTPLTFITGLKYDANVVKAVNNLTFLYDPNWEYESQNPTYPIAFFYVKKQTEEMVSETSQKPMLFYNTEGDGTNSVKAGLMNIVTDNIIIKPKVYKLDVLIPMNLDTFFSGGYYSVNNLINTNAFMFTTGEFQGNSTLASVMNFASKTMGILRTLFTALYGTELSASSLVTMLCQQQDYNKKSIEYMWRNRRILKLKLWTGWKFKYLIIQNFEVTKDGESGNFFEGTITCQEMPILTIKSSSGTANTYMSKISSVLGEGIKVATENFINVMEVTAGETE